MSTPDLVDRLAAHQTLGAAPREELEWLAAHGSLRRLGEGEILTAKGTQVAGLFVVLSGHIAIYLDRGAGRHKLTESRAGDVTGMLPVPRGWSLLPRMRSHRSPPRSLPCRGRSCPR